MRYQFDFNEPRGYVSAGPSSLYWALDTIHTASAKCCFHSRSTQLELNVLECDTISIELYSLEDFEIVSRLININELLSISHRYNWTAQDVLSTPNTEIRWIEWATVTSAHTHTHTSAMSVGTLLHSLFNRCRCAHRKQKQFDTNQIGRTH